MWVMNYQQEQLGAAAFDSPMHNFRPQVCQTAQVAAAVSELHVVIVVLLLRLLLLRQSAADHWLRLQVSDSP